MTFGRTPFVGAEEVDRRLVEPGQRAERAGDQVQLVLDDQLRGRHVGSSTPNRLCAPLTHGSVANLSAVAMISAGCSR